METKLYATKQISRGTEKPQEEKISFCSADI
jgi:hypothetical protein